MNYNFQPVVDFPEKYTFTLPILHERKFTLRPLKSSDVIGLTNFLAGLSPATRKFYSLSSFDLKMAKELCEAINKYDKLRFVLETGSSHEIIGLLEYSFSIVESDYERFQNYGIQLDEAHDCRMGICFSDPFQSRGLGSLISPYISQIPNMFDQKRIILLGGVLSENSRAINFYKKMGFEDMGLGKLPDGTEIHDMILTI